jgi:Ran-binding protein 9/10
LINKTTETNQRKSAIRQNGASSNGVDKASVTNDAFEQDMDLDNDNHTNGTGKALAPESPTQNDELFQEVILHGQELLRETQDDHGEHAQSLREIFSLIAYDDPKGSVHGHLLDSSGRFNVAEELNSAILGTRFLFLAVFLANS